MFIGLKMNEEHRKQVIEDFGRRKCSGIVKI